MLLHLHPVTYEIYFKIWLLTRKCLLGYAPEYLSDLLQYSVSHPSVRLLLIAESRLTHTTDSYNWASILSF